MQMWVDVDRDASHGVEVTEAFDYGVLILKILTDGGCKLAWIVIVWLGNKWYVMGVFAK